MTEKSTQPTQLVLTRDSAAGRIKVDMEAFFDFSFWMAEELEDLVAQWQHRAVVANEDDLRRSNSPPSKPDRSSM